MLWLKRHEPEAFARCAAVLLPHDFVNLRLTGRRCMECGDASGTGVLDARSRSFSAAACAAVDARFLSMLPPLVLLPCFTQLPAAVAIVAPQASQ